MPLRRRVPVLVSVFAVQNASHITQPFFYALFSTNSGLSTNSGVSFMGSHPRTRI